MLYREKSFRGHGVGKRHCLYENLMKEARILQKFYFNIFLNSFFNNAGIQKNSYIEMSIFSF